MSMTITTYSGQSQDKTSILRKPAALNSFESYFLNISIVSPLQFELLLLVLGLQNFELYVSLENTMKNQML